MFAAPPKRPSKETLPLVLWRDLFVLVDDGNATAADYSIIRDLVVSHGESRPNGLGALVVIPPEARPPDDTGRLAIRQGLASITPMLRCTAWLVEGTGFRAAAVRATLNGIKMVVRPPFPTLISADLGEAVPWMLKHFGHVSIQDGLDAARHMRVQIDACVKRREDSRRPMAV